MKSKDIQTRLTWLLSSILEDCRRISPSIKSYLSETDERPNIDSFLLRILSNSIEAYELIQPEKLTGEFHGLSREDCEPREDKLEIAHSEREGWDFMPWLSEKLHTMQSSAKNLVKDWLTDLEKVQLRPDAPLSPKEWLQSGIEMRFRTLEEKAKTIFEEVCSDKINIKPIRHTGNSE